MAANPYKVLGAGTFGAIVHPALSNNEEPRNPAEVTKMYFNPIALQEAVASEDITRRIAGLHIPTRGYRRKYTIKNLPENIRNAYKERFKESRGYLPPETARVHMHRMAQLGFSFFDISKSPDLFLRIPYSIIIKQIIQLLETTANIYNSGNIHGDVRASNIMCNPRTGEMKIIDFDWLRPIRYFFADFPVYFYSNPPEGIFLFKWVKTAGNIGLESVLALSPDKRIYGIDHLCKNLVDYNLTKMDSSERAEVVRTLLTFVTRETSGEDIPEDDFEVRLNEIFRDLVKESAPTFDSYGLAGALKYLLDHTWIDGVVQSSREAIARGIPATITAWDKQYTTEEFKHFEEQRNVLNSIVTRLIDLDMTTRMRPEVAASTLRSVVDAPVMSALIPPAPPPPPLSPVPPTPVAAVAPAAAPLLTTSPPAAPFAAARLSSKKRSLSKKRSSSKKSTASPVPIALSSATSADFNSLPTKTLIKQIIATLKDIHKNYQAGEIYTTLTPERIMFSPKGSEFGIRVEDESYTVEDYYGEGLYGDRPRFEPPETMVIKNTKILRKMLELSGKRRYEYLLHEMEELVDIHGNKLPFADKIKVYNAVSHFMLGVLKDYKDDAVPADKAKELYNKAREGLIELSAPTYDSYGFAVSLRVVLEKVWKGRPAREREMLMSVLERLTDLNMYKRMRPDEAAKELERYESPAAAGAGARGGRRRTRKLRRNLRSLL